MLVRHEPNPNLKWSSGGAAAAAVTFLPSSLAGVAALSHALIATPLLPATRAPALLPARLPSRPLLVPLPPSFLLGISSAAATGGGGEKKRSVEMRLCARPPRRPLAFWDDNYGSNYNEFVPDSGRGTE